MLVEILLLLLLDVDEDALGEDLEPQDCFASRFLIMLLLCKGKRRRVTVIVRVTQGIRHEMDRRLVGILLNALPERFVPIPV